MKKNIDNYAYEVEKEVEYIEDTDTAKANNYTGIPLLTIIQIAVCVIIISAFMALKYISQDKFEMVKSWYITNLNDSVIAQADVNEYKDTLNSIVGSNKSVETFLPETAKLADGIYTSNNKANVPVNMSCPLSMPLKSGSITSKFGRREDPITGKLCNHSGLDISANKNQEIYAVLPGKVEEVGDSKSYGKYVIINHGNDIKTLSAHCNNINVKQGDTVSRGDKVASAGSTGRSTGNHLHVELIINGVRYNPETAINGKYINAV